MFRLLGFLIGSATSIAIILLVTGLPEFHLKDPQIDQQRFDAAVENLMARKQETEQITQQVTEHVAQTAATVQEKLNESIQEIDAETLPTEAVAEQPLNDSAEELAIQEAEFSFSPPGEDTQRPPDPQWYSFWNPFRSEIAANGFVSQLEKVTGLDYRVVRIKTGVYEVAFAYNDDDERRRKLSQISAATGLDLPDS